MIKEKQEKMNILKEKLCDGQHDSLRTFIDVLFESGYFRSMDDWNLNWLCESSERPISELPTLSCNKIGVGIDELEKGVIRITMDPEYCFDSNRRCGTYAYFPMKKRELQRFLNFFKRINDEKDSVRKNWMKESADCWYGTYEQFGNIWITTA